MKTFNQRRREALVLVSLQDLELVTAVAQVALEIPVPANRPSLLKVKGEVMGAVERIRETAQTISSEIMKDFIETASKEEVFATFEEDLRTFESLRDKEKPAINEEG